MANSFLGLYELIDDYLMNNSLREPDVLRRLREETDANNPHAEMAVSPIQGQFMMLLVKLIWAVKTLEVGVFTGYSALCTALKPALYNVFCAFDLPDRPKQLKSTIGSCTASAAGPASTAITSPYRLTRPTHCNAGGETCIGQL